MSLKSLEVITLTTKAYCTNIRHKSKVKFPKNFRKNSKTINPKTYKYIQRKCKKYELKHSLKK